MTKLTANSASSQEFLPLMHELAAAYQAFSLYDAEGLRKSGANLTPSQARVIFTIGGTDGMTCKDIGDATLITKGTLTGVIDRLEEKGLVERWAVEGDGRKTQGTRLKAKVFGRILPGLTIFELHSLLASRLPHLFLFSPCTLLCPMPFALRPIPSFPVTRNPSPCPPIVNHRIRRVNPQSRPDHGECPELAR